MSTVDYSKLIELRKIVYDTATPMATRMAAKNKYDQMLEDASTDFAEHMAKIKLELNESGNAC